jgi:hypothetical protein
MTPRSAVPVARVEQAGERLRLIPGRGSPAGKARLAGSAGSVSLGGGQRQAGKPYRSISATGRDFSCAPGAGRGERVASATLSHQLQGRPLVSTRGSNGGENPRRDDQGAAVTAVAAWLDFNLCCYRWAPHTASLSLSRRLRG